MNILTLLKSPVTAIVKHRKGLVGTIGTVVVTAIFSVAIETYEVAHNADDRSQNIAQKQAALKASFTHRTDHVDTRLTETNARIDKLHDKVDQLYDDDGALPMLEKDDMMLKKHDINNGQTK